MAARIQLPGRARRGEVIRVGILIQHPMPGIAANPFLQFHTVALDSGELEFSWVDDAGQPGSAREAIEVI